MMARLCLAALLFAVLAGLAGCCGEYYTPKPTQPVMPTSVSWGMEEQPQENK